MSSQVPTWPWRRLSFFWTEAGSLAAGSARKLFLVDDFCTGNYVAPTSPGILSFGTITDHVGEASLSVSDG